MTTASVTLTFTEIKNILGFGLPDSARKRPQWWANEISAHSRHTQRVWLDAGWKTRGLDLHFNRVTFARGSIPQRGHTSSDADPKTMSPPTQAATSERRRRIGLVSCTKAKLSRPAPARDLYSASDLFRKAAAYCDAYLDGWFVLSAKHGLVEPNRVLEPYDVTLKTMSNSQRKDWGVRVAQQLRQLGDVALEVHAGADYVQPLLEAGLVVDNPLRGLSIGPRKHWYLEHLS
jgi:hypothetical protein